MRRLEEGASEPLFDCFLCFRGDVHASKPLIFHDSQVVVHGMAPSHAAQTPFPREARGSQSRVVNAFLMDIRLPQCRGLQDGLEARMSLFGAYHDG